MTVHLEERERDGTMAGQFTAAQGMNTLREKNGHSGMAKIVNLEFWNTGFFQDVIFVLSEILSALSCIPR